MAFAALTIDINAKLAGLEQGLKRSEAQLTTFASRAESAAASVAAAFGAIVGGVAISAAADRLMATVDSMDALNDASDRTGSSVEELSSLLNTLAPYGATLDQITDATGKLARAMAGADDETKGAGAAFAALGVETRDAAGNLRPTVDVLDDVARELAKYEDGTNKTVLAQTLFGKTGAALLPLLKDLATAQKAAASVTTEQAEAAEKLNVELGKIRVAADAAAVSIASKIVPDLARLAEQFRLTAQAGGTFWESLRGALGPNKFAAELEGDLRELQLRRDRLAGDTRPLMQRGKDEGLRELDQQIAAIEARLQRIRPAQRASGAMQDQFDGVTPGGAAGRTAAPRLPAAAGPAAPVREARDAYAELDALIRQANIDDELKQQAKAAKELADQLERAADAALARVAANDRAEQDADSGIQRDLEAIRDAIDPTRALYRDLERVRDLMGAGLLSGDAGNARQAQILSRIDGILGGKLPEAVDAATSAAREFGLTFTSAFEDAVVGGKKVGDMLKGLEADILRVLVRQQLTGPLLDLLGGTFDSKKSGGTIAGSIFAALGLTRAAGGPVSAGVPYLVGERGPELIVPRSAGTVLPNGSFGGGVTIVNNIDSRADRSAIAADIQRSQLASLAMLQDMRARGKAA